MEFSPTKNPPSFIANPYLDPKSIITSSLGQKFYDFEEKTPNVVILKIVSGVPNSQLGQIEVNFCWLWNIFLSLETDLAWNEFYFL